MELLTLRYANIIQIVLHSFPNLCANLHSHQQCVKVPVAPQLAAILHGQWFFFQLYWCVYVVESHGGFNMHFPDDTQVELLNYIYWIRIFSFVKGLFKFWAPWKEDLSIFSYLFVGVTYVFQVHRDK